MILRPVHAVFTGLVLRSWALWAGWLLWFMLFQAWCEVSPGGVVQSINQIITYVRHFCTLCTYTFAILHLSVS